jgi:hypothetical protein
VRTGDGRRALDLERSRAVVSRVVRVASRRVASSRRDVPPPRLSTATPTRVDARRDDDETMRCAR